jgi:hypothetical protein
MLASMPEFKFDVSRPELEKHLKGRVAHHTDRAKFYVDKAASLRVAAEKCAAGESGVTLPDEILDAISVEQDHYSGGMGSMGVVPRVRQFKQKLESAQDKIKEQVAQHVERLVLQHEGIAGLHRARAEELTFYVGHLPAQSVFELTHGDLAKFELVGGKDSKFDGRGDYMELRAGGLGQYVEQY